MPVNLPRIEGNSSRGFTMIEVLVTLVILMVGLLGIAGLMAQGQRASFEAYQRQQALALANDMAERIKANRPGVDSTAVATTYDASIGSGAAATLGSGTRFAQLVAGSITNCATTNCTTAQVVAYDAALWDGLLQGAAGETDSTTGAAIGPILRPRGCVQQLPGATACPAPGGAPTSRQVTYRVSVAWQGNFPTQPPTALDAENTCGENQYQFQNVTNDANRKMVSVDVYTVLACP
jgi:type IV pilus assembly protein PilV